MAEELAQDATWISRFNRESQIHAPLDHPNVAAARAGLDAERLENSWRVETALGPQAAIAGELDIEGPLREG